MNLIATRIAVVEQYLPHIIYAYARAWDEIVNEGFDEINDWSVKFDEFDRQICDLYQLSMDNIYFCYLNAQKSIEFSTRQRESGATED